MTGSPFLSDPGRAPRARADGDGQEQAEPDLYPPAPLEEPAPQVVDGWSEAGAGAVFGAVGLILNGAVRARGGGPPDVYVPTDQERSEFGRAFAAYCNRHPMLARFGTHGELAAMGIVLGQWAVRETGRAAEFRAVQEDDQQEVLVGARAAPAPASGPTVRPAGNPFARPQDPGE